MRWARPLLLTLLPHPPSRPQPHPHLTLLPHPPPSPSPSPPPHPLTYLLVCLYASQSLAQDEDEGIKFAPVKKGMLSCGLVNSTVMESWVRIHACMRALTLTFTPYPYP